jgi:hypothetical protein
VLQINPYGYPPAVASGDVQDSVPPRVAVIAGPLSSDEPLILAELTVTQIVMGVSDLKKIASETPRLLAGEYAYLSLASKELSRIVQQLEACQKEAAE